MYPLKLIKDTFNKQQKKYKNIILNGQKLTRVNKQSYKDHWNKSNKVFERHMQNILLNVIKVDLK